MFGLGVNELLIVLVLVLVLFGGTKLPQLARGLGQGLKEFKSASKETDDEVSDKEPTRERDDKN